MAEWKQRIHFEGVDEGGARSDPDVPPALPLETYGAAGLQPSGEPMAFAVAPTRSSEQHSLVGRGGTAVIETPAEGDEHGELLLVRIDDAIRAVVPDRSRSGRDVTAFALPVSPGPQGDRGTSGAAGHWLTQKVIFPLVDPVLGEVGDGFVRTWEASRRAHRVRFFAPDDYRTRRARTVEPGDIRPGPVMLLIHGSDSQPDSASGFGALPATLVADLHGQYRRQVIAFDHPTLATDPVENGRWLAAWLDAVSADIQLDVVCHGRGGLVARLLTERPDLLGQRTPAPVRSVTFVATPHRGTPLAARGHMGRFVDRLLTLAASGTDPAATPALEGALAVARQLAAGFDEGLDGIACMRPADPEDKDAGLWLDGFDDGRRRPAGVRYRAIASDFEPAAGSGWWHALRDAGVDAAFEGSPNDTVVPTLSALSLGPDPGSGLDDMVVLDELDGIAHQGYFGADPLQPVLGAWLRPEPTPLSPAARRRLLRRSDVEALAELGPEWSLARAHELTCTPPVAMQPALRDLVEAEGAQLWSTTTSRPDGTTPPIAVLVPGFMGSELAIGAERVWLSPWRLAHGTVEALRLPATDPERAARPRSLVCAGYRAAIDRLAREFQVVAFPYDWRDDIEIAATRLARLVGALLDHAEMSALPVHVVAHSTGGLVARRALAAGGGGQRGRPALHDQLAARGGRVVLAGTPNHGSIVTPLALIGRHPILGSLARVDMRRPPSAWLDVAWTFPGLLQLLPCPALAGDPDGDDGVGWLYDPARWPRRHGAPSLLRAARDFHAVLDATDGDGLHVVLGDAVPTPVAIRPLGSDRFEVAMADAGDGTVACRSGELERATTYYAPGVEHGNLLADAPTLEAVVDILDRGTTARLHSEPARRAPQDGVPTAEWLSVEDADARLTRVQRATRDAAPVGRDVWTRRDALRVALDALGPLMGTAGSQLPPLRIGIVHGGVECASEPVLVGHATGTPITGGAEARCDELLGSQLSSLQVLGLYPDAPGTWRFVPRRRASDRVKGCIVLGLDSSEPLSRGVLSDIVTRAVVDYVDRIAADPDAPAEGRRGPAMLARGDGPLGLSAVAIGCSGSLGLDIERSITSVVQGIQRANEMLAKVGRPVVEKLELIDSYAGKVERIRWALDRLVARQTAARQANGAAIDQALLLAGDVVGSEGRRDGMPPPEYESGRWEHLSVDVEPLGDGGSGDEVHLTYRFSRSRAAAREAPRRIDRTVVFGVLEDAVANPAQSVELGRVLYEELLPVEVKDELSRIDNLVLQVDDRTADLPWELFGDRLAGDEPLACRVGLLRQLRDRSLRVRPSGGTPDTALVIGDPPTDLRSLPSARIEARDVAGLLRGAGMDVASIDFPEGTVGSTATANRIRKAFWARDHRVVHVAAHGLYQVGGARGVVEGGVVIGPRTFLTADDFDNLRATPDLVFLNCCHLGRLRPGEEAGTSGLLDTVGQQRAAATLASALMRIGVRAVVVAGWQVDDQVASRFAGEFYRRLLDGLPYGEAVKQARMACFASGDATDNTWAAYQCYGDPAFRLWRETQSRSGTVGEMTTRSAAMRAVDDLHTRVAEVTDHEPLRAELTSIDEQVARRWPQDGQLLTALAGGWAGTGDYEKAIERYEAAVAAADGTAPVRAVEQLVNLSARRALEVHRTGGRAPEAGEDVDALLTKGDHWTEVVAGLGGGSGERRGLEASYCKRLAILRPRRRRQYVERATTGYVDAFASDPTNLWGFRNAVQLAAVCGGERATWLDELPSRADAMARWTGDIGRPTEWARFWHRVGSADSRLTAAVVDPATPLGAQVLELLSDHCLDGVAAGRARTLVENGLPGLVGVLTSAYATALIGGFSRLDWRSVVEHVADLADLAAAADVAAAGPLALLHDQLDRVATQAPSTLT